MPSVKIPKLLAMLTFLVATAALCWRYFFVVPPNIVSGVTLDDRARSEMETVSEPKFKPAIDVYVDNLKYYGTLDYAAVDPSSPQAVRTVTERLIKTEVSRDAKTRAALDTFSAEATTSLAAHLAILLSRCAGLSNVDYRRAIGEDVPLHEPDNLIRFGYFQEDAGWIPAGAFKTIAQSPPSTEPTKVEADFNRAFDASNQYRDGSNSIVGVATGAGEAIVAVDAVPYLDPCDEANGSLDQFESRVDDVRWRHFFGAVAQGSLVFVSKSPAYDELGLKDHRLRAQIGVIVHTRGNDYYPLHFHSYYEPNTQQWRLIYVNRCCSPRMATALLLVF